MAKDPVTPMSLINRYLNMITWTGYNPRNRPKLNYVLGVYIIIDVANTLILSGVHILTNPYTDFSLVIIDVVLFIGYWQVIAKTLTLFTKQRALSKLFDIVEYKFWSLDVLPPSERREIQNVYDATRLASNSYTIGVLTTFFGHYVTAYLRGQESLAINIWMPEVLRDWNRTVLGHNILFVVQAVLVLIEGICSLIAVDGLYIVLISSVLGQLKILKCRILAIDDKRIPHENMKEVAICVEQHNLLFDFLYTIEEIFSGELLHVLGSVIAISVFSMYYCMIEKDIGRIITCGFIFMTANIQLFIYCFMGQLLQDETRSIADAAYLCRWQDIPDKNVRLSLMLVMLRSQQFFSITLGGVLILCLETFTSVSRMMLSLLTFMMNFDVGK